MLYASAVHGTNTKAQEYLAGWQRARAELDNFRKRTIDEQSRQRSQVTQEVISSLMTLVDNFNAMTNHVPAELTDHTWTQGVLHVARQLDQLLAEFNVTPVGTVGQPFDPAKHEAIKQTKHKTIKSGVIIDVVQPGYMIGDQVLRPAKVTVAK